ncbi:MAG: hypothetical protein WAU36_04075 [Cyclobacteriaceae bacterium]
MKPTNGKATTIMIRDLSKKDNVILKELKSDFGTEFNTVAVMKASYQYLEQKKIIATQSSKIDALCIQIENLNDALNSLKESVSEYFSFGIDTKKKEAELVSNLQSLIQQPKKSIRKKTEVKKQGRGLSSLS